ncbi:hypothetical protein [Enhygromyxa salina]|uniref:Uncharacterized protein n=1 Tax=Enhygromyxa salina TaxID=215803 RepID=A0A2S9XQQ4_9BACT|nr:hypothetical protein [Enhygromyxa salina]PRP95186.1 hypothetical protein ENSA7_75000 [Enhygromyxa salina]
MHASSSIRRKAPFTPWFAALILGATAHAGWLVHELRSEAHPTEQPTSVIVHVDARPTRTTAPSQQQPQRAIYRRDQARARPAASPRCRHVQAGSQPEEPAPLNLDIWVQRTDRYVYTIDRRVLDEVPFGPVDANLERIRVVAKTLAEARETAMSEASAGRAIELRNIHSGTPLWLLGLRNGDRLLAISTRGEVELDHVELSIERRGRPLALSYELI